MTLLKKLGGNLKQKLQNNELTLGSWLTINHQSVIEIMGTAGFDWLCIDIEHSAIAINDVVNLVGHIQGNDMQALVRVSENNPVIIKQVMDSGVDGVIIPMVNSLNDAKKAVSSVRYPSFGKRGVGLSRAQNYGIGFEEYKQWLENDSVIIVQIEHYLAVEELESILNLSGVDGIIVGPYDLSASMGLPGDFEHPEVIKTLKKIDEICLKNKKPLGFHVISSDHKKTLEKINSGYTFLAVSLDFLFLGDSARSEMSLIRKAINDGKK
ncbi:MAG: HpcH/HpaI aldolase family protein [Schleiferiaceae bacterium]